MINNIYIFSEKINVMTGGQQPLIGTCEKHSSEIEGGKIN